MDTFGPDTTAAAYGETFYDSWKASGRGSLACGCSSRFRNLGFIRFWGLGSRCWDCRVLGSSVGELKVCRFLL